MDVYNPLYKNQGIHVISSLFTIEKGVTKVLIIKRKNPPYDGSWALVGGALYNNEDVEAGMKREISEKTGITDIDIIFSGIFGKYDRSPVMRMVATTFIGVLDIKKVSVLKETYMTSDAKWVPIEQVPKLAFDHNDILQEAVKTLKEKIVNSDILKSLFPEGFTIPELQKVYEAIFERKYDRRNFRKKLLSLGIIVDTNKTNVFEGSKPAKIYKFKTKKKINLF